MRTLIEATLNQVYYFSELRSNQNSQRHLANLGLVKGTAVRVLQHNKKGELIILVKDARLALDHQLASQMLVSETELGVKQSKSLAEIPLGITTQVAQVLGQGAIRRRLMDMGLTRGVEIQIRKVAPLGDPLEISLRGYELTLRKKEAELVLVKEV